MRLVFLLSVVSIFAGAVGADFLSDAGAALPACAMGCLSTAVATSTCPTGNLTCICANVALSQHTESCINANCTVKESLVTKNFTTVECGLPVRSRTKSVPYTGIAGAILALIMVSLRMVQRLPAFGGSFGLDDVFILASTVVMIPLSVLSVFLAKDGLGQDIWKVPFDKITNILYIYYFDEMMYISSLCLTRMSILIFYTRIFSMRDFCRAAYFLMACNFCALVCLDFALIFQCKPISMAWKRWDGQQHGTCLNVNAIIRSAAAINIVLDLATIALPLPQIAKLQLSKRKKIPLLFVFLLGFFVTIISCLRIKYLSQFADTMNPTWDYVSIGYWSTIEVHLSIIITCSPALRALIKSLFPNCSLISSRSNGPSHSTTAKTQFTVTDRSTSRFSLTGNDNFIPLGDLQESSPKETVRPSSKSNIWVEQSWHLESHDKEENMPDQGLGSK